MTVEILDKKIEKYLIDKDIIDLLYGNINDNDEFENIFYYDD